MIEAAAPAPPPLIVLDRSIGGVRLGETRRAAERVAGRGVVVSNVVDRSGPKPIRVTRVSYGHGSLVVTYTALRAASLETSSARYRTRSGVGVGSSYAAMRRLGGVQCFAAGIECQHGFASVNRPGTAFRLSRPHGRVITVVITTGH